MGRVLAVDIGASSYRVIEGSYRDGQLAMKVLERFKHAPVYEEGHYRWDIEQIAENITAVLREAAKEGEAIDSVGFDSFGTDFGLLDEQGRLLEKPLAYRDAVSDGMYEKYFGREKEWYKTIGGTFGNTSTAHILKGMTESGFAALPKAQYLLFIPDLLTYMFTGKLINEGTIATTSRLLDIHKKEWLSEFIEELGIPPQIFHPLTKSGETVGRLRPDIIKGRENLRETVVVTVACHDTASAVVTIPPMQRCSFISSGTWSVKGIVSQVPYVSQKACKYHMSNEGQPQGYRLIRNITGLWLIEECVRYWKEEGMDVKIADLAKEADAAEAFPSMIYTDAPDFTKPGKMPEKIKDYCRRTKQQVPETPVEIMQTVVQGLACEYRRHNEELYDVTGQAVKTIYIVGGGRNNGYLNQCTANACSCKVIAGHPEATAMGNLLMQLQAGGEIGSDKEFADIVQRNVPAEIYEPEQMSKWDEKYQFYLRLIIDAAGGTK